MGKGVPEWAPGSKGYVISFPRAMSQAAALARIFGECREGQIPRPLGRKERKGSVVFMQKYIVLGLLGLCSWEDMKGKKLTVVYILLFGIGGMMLHLFSPVCSIYSILSGILLGLAMMLASLATRGMVGMGDGILLTVTGVYLGGTGNLELLFIGLLLAACWSLVMIVGKKKKGKDQIAFVPFLLASYLTMLLRWQP